MIEREGDFEIRLESLINQIFVPDNTHFVILDPASSGFYGNYLANNINRTPMQITNVEVPIQGEPFLGYSAIAYSKLNPYVENGVSNFILFKSVADNWEQYRFVIEILQDCGVPRENIITTAYLKSNDINLDYSIISQDTTENVIFWWQKQFRNE